MVRLLTPKVHKRPMIEGEDIQGPFGGIANMTSRGAYALVTRVNPTVFIVDTETDLCFSSYKLSSFLEYTVQGECFGAAVSYDGSEIFMLLVHDSYHVVIYKLSLTKNWLTALSLVPFSKVRIDPSKRVLTTSSIRWEDTTSPCEILENIILASTNIRLAEFTGSPETSLSGLLLNKMDIPPRLTRIRGQLVVGMTCPVALDWALHNEITSDTWALATDPTLPVEDDDDDPQRPAEPIHPDMFPWMEDPYSFPLTGEEIPDSMHPAGSLVTIDWKTYKRYVEIYDPEGAVTGKPESWYAKTSTIHTGYGIGTYLVSFDIMTGRLTGVTMVGSSYVS